MRSTGAGRSLRRLARGGRMQVRHRRRANQRLCITRLLNKTPRILAPVRRDRGTAVSRWLLLLAVAFGVLAMHHVPASAATHPAPSVHVAQASHIAGPQLPDAVHEDQQPGPHGSHELIHECLAVLAQAGLVMVALVLFLGLFRESVQGYTEDAASRARAPDRPPCTGGRAILTPVCVMRV